MTGERAPLSLQVENGRLTVAGARGEALLAECHAAVGLSSGALYTTAGGTAMKSADGVEVRGRDALLWPALRWHVAIAGAGHALRLWLEVENRTPLALAIERLDVLVVPAGYRRAPAQSVRAVQTGWQSWSPAAPLTPLSDLGRAQPPVAAPMLPATEAEGVVLPWMALLEIPSGHGLLAGFITAQDWQSALAVHPATAGHRLTASCYAEGLALAPGATLRSEILLLQFDLPEDDALAVYGQHLRASMALAVKGCQAAPEQAPDRPAAAKAVPTGWCSWYCFHTAVTAVDVLRNLEWLAAARAQIPLEYIQLDDGYEAEVGDWLILNDRFPGGMRSVTGAIHDAGFKAGLWLAPFIVSERSRVYAEHPEWVLRDDGGRPVLAIWNWGSANYALDMTHSGAGQWLTGVIRTIVDDWGYDYLKLDFIYAGALRGRHADREATSVQSYRRGLSIIRSAARRCYLLGCGGPFAPSVGLVDGMRVGPDVAPFWMAEREEDLALVGLYRSVRSTLAHAWMHGRLWTNDPDCVLLRARGSELTLPEIQAWASLVALSGGTVMFSDDMSRLEPERAELASRLLPPLGQAALSLGPVVNAMATRQHLDIERPWERWATVALYNWGAEPAAARFDPGDRPDIPARYHLFDLWSGEHWGPQAGAVDLGPIPSHGVRLLAVHGHRGRPQLVGTTLHLLGGAVEWSGESWRDDTLTLSLQCPGERRGTVVVFVPPGYEWIPGAAPDEGWRAGAEQRDNLLVISVHLHERAQVSLQFRHNG